MSANKAKLEAYQRQKPPTNPDELAQYLMRRLEAAEASIATQEKCINQERELRKNVSKFLKAQNKQLKDMVEMEKRNLSDKVSAELDSTLKQAVKEKVEIKMELDEMRKQMRDQQQEYQELQDMYTSIKETQRENEQFNNDSQKLIDEYERDIKFVQNEKEHLQKQNISLTEERNRAMKDYEEILAVVKKLDESRFIMNKLMGPDGALGKGQRDKYLHGN